MSDLLIYGAFILALAAFARTRTVTDRFESQLAALRTEIEALKAGRTAAEIGPTGAEAQLAVPVSGEPADGTGLEATGEAAAGSETPDPGQPEPEMAAGRNTILSGEAMESLLGGRWAVWVGGLALALGGVFLVKVSIDAGLLSPAVRLALATLFALALMGAGEAVRRRTGLWQGALFANAMVPGILTAAGAATLMGVAYAAHGIYGFIGPSLAFVGMGGICLCVLALSRLHGQPLAGLGLAGSLVTPLLVSSHTASAWSLFLFLTIAWMAALAAARLGRWRIVPTLGNIGLGLWAFLACLTTPDIDPLPVTLALLFLVAGLAFVWPGRADEGIDPAGAAAAGNDHRWRNLMHLIGPPEAPIIVTGALAVLAAVFSLLAFADSVGPVVTLCFWALVGALGLWGAMRPVAASAGVVAGLAAIGGLSILLTLPASATGFDARLSAFLLSGLFVLLSTLALLRPLSRPFHTAVWTAIAGVVSICLCTLSFLIAGRLAIDLPHGLVSLALAGAFLAQAEMVWRRQAPAQGEGGLCLALMAGLAHLVIAAHTLSETLATTLILAVVATGFAAATRLRPWRALPWVAVAGFLVVLARYGWQPSIVSADALGRIPVFNALLPGYGIPALLALGSAYALRRWPSVRLRNALQAIACLFCLLTLAILVRHAMNGGQLQGGLPTLAEQSIYTLIFIGASGILLRMDLSAPGSFLRLGGMALGFFSIVMVLSAHLVGLNPYLTGETLGRYPMVDLLLIGYLLPALAYGALARMAAGRRPPVYVATLAAVSALLAFVWATLSVRRFWQGEGIADWKGFLPGETYTYSVVWLAMGVALLTLGSRFNDRSLRIASAVLVFVTVLKVFLVDMSNLEGLLRALSFMGLGAVLIGIGLFYQKLLSRPARRDEGKLL